MKKIQINNTIRKIVLAGLGISIVILGFLWYQMLNEVKTEEMENTRFTYEWNEFVTWETKVIENPVIIDSVLGENDFVYKDLTDYVKVMFDIPLVSDIPLSFTGTITLKASLQAVVGEEAELAWEKIDAYEENDIMLTGDRLSFGDEIETRIMPHKTFISEVEEEFSLGTSYVYVFEYDIDGILENEYGNYPFHITPKAEFLIMNTVDKGKKSINDITVFEDVVKNTVVLPIDDRMLMIVRILLIILVVISIIIAILTENKPKKDEFDSFSEKFIREHGDRMVSIPKSLSLQYGNVMIVKDPSDMIKAADEINQPIFYYYVNDNEQRKIEMFIFDDVRVYYYSKIGIMKETQEVSVEEPKSML